MGECGFWDHFLSSIETFRSLDNIEDFIRLTTFSAYHQVWSFMLQLRWLMCWQLSLHFRLSDRRKRRVLDSMIRDRINRQNRGPGDMEIWRAKRVDHRRRPWWITSIHLEFQQFLQKFSALFLRSASAFLPKFRPLLRMAHTLRYAQSFRKVVVRTNAKCHINHIYEQSITQRGRFRRFH